MRCPDCSTMMPAHQRFCGSCGGAMTMTSPGYDALDRLDEVLNGRYRLKSLLGIGGNGAVYQAENVDLGHSVAVKVLHPALLHDGTARRRIENEARLASQIDHPNIVSILDFHSTSELTYLVMEYLSGVSLAEVLYEVGYLGVRRTIHVARQVLSALEASHAIGVLHRDLKPENIYLIARQDDLDFVKVLDFGMATVTHLPQAARITAANRICGTPAYMAPEQVRNRDLTEQTDIYAVGVLLYECLTGDNPFLTQSASDTMVNHVTLSPEQPSKHKKEAGIPPYLDAVVMRALRKDPKQRFRSGEEFRRVLEGLVLAQQKRETGSEHTALQTCQECGKPNPTTAEQCDACGHSLAGEGPLDRSAMSPDIIDALDASSSSDREAEYNLAPTTTTVTTYRPVGWSPPLIGREKEVELLSELLSFGPPPYVQRFVRIIGAPGSGKARLAREVVTRASREWKVVWIEPEILPVYASLYPIQRAAARLLNLMLPVDDPGVVCDAAAELGVGMLHREGLLELFGMSEDVKGPAAPRRVQRARAWREIVRIANSKRPLLLVFQDVHLYDGPSQELVAATVSRDPSGKLAIVATHDPQLLLLWGETRTLALSSLDRADSEQLARKFFEYLGIDPEELDADGDLDQVVSLSGGNPMLLIEAARLAAAEGKATRQRGLAAVINQRIGQLPPRSRMMVHTMAVLGRPATSETLVGLMRGAAESDEHALRFLGGLGFLVGDSEGWRFSHRLHREVAYASTPAAVRQQLHAKAAEVAIAEGQRAAFIAHHLFEAGDAEQAVPYLLRAGRSALHCLDDNLGKDTFTRALRLIPPPPTEFGGRKPWLNATLGLAIAIHDGGDRITASRFLRRAAQQAGRAGWESEAQSCLRQAERLKV